MPASHVHVYEARVNRQLVNSDKHLQQGFSLLASTNAAEAIRRNTVFLIRLYFPVILISFCIFNISMYYSVYFFPQFYQNNVFRSDKKRVQIKYQA